MKDLGEKSGEKIGRVFGWEGEWKILWWDPNVFSQAHQKVFSLKGGENEAV